MTRKYEGGKVIKEGERYILTGNTNTWDTNYHPGHTVILIHKNTGIEYLLDIADICQLSDIDLDNKSDLAELINLAWKAKMSVSTYERLG